MSSITSGVGLFSGLDTGSIINQLLAAESRTKVLAQQRLVRLQAEQAAFLDISSRLNTLKTAAQKLRTSRTFDAASATSSNPDALSAVASAGAAQGSYRFIVDRVVGTQRLLSRGYADREVSPTGLTAITLESDLARLDRETALSTLNGGAGVERGRIVMTDSSGATATVDLSRVATVNEVVERINTSGLRVSAQVEGNRFVIVDQAGGGGTMSIADAAGSNTATSLGIVGSATGGTLTGAAVYTLGDSITLSALNDGNGVRRASAVGGIDLVIQTRDGSNYNVALGEILSGGTISSPAAVTVGDLRARIESQTDGKVTLEVSTDGTAFRLVDSSVGGGNLTVANGASSSAATDLGLAGSSAGPSLTGSTVFATMNTTLVRNLVGGAGLSSGAISITGRDGEVYSFSLSTGGTVSSLLREISDNTGGAVTASLSSSGTGIVLSDNSGGSGNFIVSGAGATSLGIATETGGVASATVNGTRLQRQYVAGATLLSSLNGGRGVGTGRFEITDSSGRTAVVDIAGDTRTVSDMLAEINSRGLSVKARINDNGDGILIEEDATAGPTGTQRIRVRDLSGTVARSLNLAGTATGSGSSNFIDGSFEVRIEFGPADSLRRVMDTINTRGGGVRASIVNVGGGLSPYRLSLTATQTGRAGRFIADFEGTDPGFTTTNRGDDARVFFGSDDAASGVLLESTTNTMDGVIEGLSIDLRSASATPVEVTVTQDTAAIEAGVRAFVDAFNDLSGRISTLTSYNSATNQRGTLLGDSTVERLRSSLFRLVQGRPTGVSGSLQTLASVGVTVGRGGQLELNSERLRSALESDPEAVKSLFSARSQEQASGPIEVLPGVFDVTGSRAAGGFTSLGIAEQVAELANTYTDSVSGFLKSRGNTFDSQLKLQRERITAFDARLARRRAVLERQFATMEQAIASLQQQQGSISSLSALAASASGRR